MKINKSDIISRLGIVNLRGKEYVKLPLLICKKHWVECQIKTTKDPEGIIVHCIYCVEDEKRVSSLQA